MRFKSVRERSLIIVNTLRIIIIYIQLLTLLYNNKIRSFEAKEISVLSYISDGIIIYNFLVIDH